MNKLYNPKFGIAESTPFRTVTHTFATKVRPSIEERAKELTHDLEEKNYRKGQSKIKSWGGKGWGGP